MSAAGHILTMESITRIHREGPHAVTALQDIDLALRPGEFVAVMGPSGSGKSTLLNLAGALDTPTSGRILVEGSELAGLSPTQRADLRRRSIGFVFQDFNLLPSLTAVENVAFPLELDGAPTATARAQALEALDGVGVADLADRFPDDVSGGQAQRIAIARALIGPRRLLLADEPTGSLDSVAGSEVMSVLRQRADDGAAVMLVTHEPRFAAWADRTVFLRDGRMVGASAAEDPAVLLASPGGYRAQG